MNLMIDLETLGTNELSPIISIGAVLFDINGIKKEFYTNLDVSEQINSKKRFADAETIKWWMQQDNAAKNVFKESFLPTIKGLGEFNEFILLGNNKKDIKPWGNGATFDITLLETLYRQYDVDVPWDFWNIRDLRTFKEFVYNGEDTIREGTHHNALDDSIFQAQIVIDGLKK